MSARDMTEAPRAIDATGGYYPVYPIGRGPDTPTTPPSAATHYTYDTDTGDAVDWLREVVVKSSRGRPSEDPASDLFPAAESVESIRGRHPGISLYVTSAYEVIGQVAP